MPFKQLASPDPEYLTATDILIGDMSDTNYEFLLFDRPVILLANQWLRENFPDIGIKTDLAGLESAIQRSIENPAEFHEPRALWLGKTIYQPDGQSAGRCLDIMMERADIKNPRFVFIHGGDAVRKTNLAPMYLEARRRGLDADFVVSQRKSRGRDDTVYVAAHVADLNISGGYKVHFDHGLKSQGTANVPAAIEYYRENDYFPLNDLHITAGEVGQVRTEMLLGPRRDRAVIGGYPKADDLLRLNTAENKSGVFRKLGFEAGQPLITYASAGRQGQDKPGGSLNEEVIAVLKDISSRRGYNILVKLKYPKGIIVLQALNKLRRMLAF
jgi:hypothetical protein